VPAVCLVVAARRRWRRAGRPPRPTGRQAAGPAPHPPIRA
jgi:hypothetical protein